MAKSKGSFGSIAVTTRFNDAAIEFFNSWSWLITGGLRRGDGVLLPNMKRVFAHFAANNIVRAFLKEDFDSLLFIDDDMVFEIDALSRMRDNKENWKYDIVGGFYTSRQRPTRPQVYRWSEKQKKDAPYYGWTYEMQHNWEPGDVVEVDAVGLGFTLIRRRVFEKLLGNRDADRYAWFLMAQTSVTEDFHFSFLAREKGFRMAIDTGIHLGHVGNHIYTMDDYLEDRKEFIDDEG